MLETGAQITVTQADDFVGTATRDLLSGDRIYTLYAASVSDGLCQLLSAGYLADVSDMAYVDRDSPLFDFGVTDSLSLFGKTYFLSSTVLDVRRDAYVVLYNRAFEEKIPLQEGERTLASLALDGHFTLEAMLSVSRAVCSSKDMQADAFGERAAEETFYGIAAADDVLDAVYYGLGGRFAATTEDAVSIVSLSALKSALGLADTFLCDASRTPGADAFGDSTALFTVCKLSEISSRYGQLPEIGILPMPKANADDAYRCLVDLSQTELMAVPAGTADTDTIGYLLSRMAFLSDGYVTPYFEKEVSREDADNLLMLSLIRESTVSDLSLLFGYGDISGLLADTLANGDKRLALQYYNRKTLYEKALTVIDHRCAAK